MEILYVQASPVEDFYSPCVCDPGFLHPRRAYFHFHPVSTTLHTPIPVLADEELAEAIRQAQETLDIWRQEFLAPKKSYSITSLKVRFGEQGDIEDMWTEPLYVLDNLYTVRILFQRFAVVIAIVSFFYTLASNARVTAIGEMKSQLNSWNRLWQNSRERSHKAEMMNATVVAVSKSVIHSFSKPNQKSIQLRIGLGVEGDAHMGEKVQHRSRVAKDPNQPNLRQVHLIHAELHEELRERGFNVSAGQMGENITTRGIDLLALPRGLGFT